jgi:hypothetical protein
MIDFQQSLVKMSINLTDLLSSFETVPIELIPELRAKILNEVRQRYLDEIDPELWKAYFENDDVDNRLQDFLGYTNTIVEQTIRKYLGSLPDKNFRYLLETLWDESQVVWLEQEVNLKPIFDFLGFLHRKAQKVIDESFPKFEEVFGNMAHSLLLDLCFQSLLSRYSKVTKPNLVDLRRMINIAGQIIEAIFFFQIFMEEKTLGDIIKTLKKPSDKDIDLFSKYKKRNILGDSTFIKALRTIQMKRNDYSHGWSDGQTVENDYQQCVNALINEPDGVLRLLYTVLDNRE